MGGEVTLHLAGAEYVQVEANGLQEAIAAAPAPGRPRPGMPWRTFRYGDGAVSMILSGRGAAADRATEAVADQARLTSYVREDGGVRCYFTFRVSNWSQRTLPLRLPAGARPLAVRIDGLVLPLDAAPVPSESGVLDLGVPRPANGTAGEAVHRFEVVYDSGAPAPRAVPWMTVAAPTPGLPVPALTFRRTWRLPPGFEPVPDGRQRRVPGAGSAIDEILPRPLTEQFLLTSKLPELVTAHPPASDQVEGLAAAAAGLRPKSGGRVVRLREMVSDLARSYLAGRLVVDCDALREAGINDETLVAIEPSDGANENLPPWEAIGLRTTAVASATLLTTAGRVHQWGLAPAPSDLVAKSVGLALENGHDESGRYRTASDWIRHSADRSREGLPVLAVPDPGSAFETWTEWEPVAGLSDDSTLVAVPQQRVTAGALVLAAGLVASLWLVRRRAALLSAWLTLSGFAVLWLPTALRPLAWLPLLAGTAAALVLAAIAARRSRRAQEALREARVAGSAALLLTLVAFGRSTGIAETQSAVTVYVVPDQGGVSEAVLAPADFLDRLDALASSTTSSVTPVVLSATYEGKVVQGIAEFDAVYEAYSPGATAALSLPLDAVTLDGDVVIDGARTLPVAAAPPGVGFSVLLREAGRHRIQVRFRVPVTDFGDSRSLHFAVPRTVQDRVRLALPAGSTAAEIGERLGSGRMTSDQGAPVLEADLGHVSSPLHFRWTQDGRPASTAVREAYLWDFQPGACTLTGVLNYRVSSGTLASVSIEIPAGLDVQAVDVRRVGPGEPLRLRDWSWTSTAPARVMEADITPPGAGEFQVGLTLVPSSPLTQEVTLPLPVPHGVAAGDRGHLAYRAKGVAVAALSTRWLTGGPPEAFAPFWPEASRPDLHSVNRAGSVYTATFRRESGQSPLLRLRLAPAAHRLRLLQHESKVRIFAHHGELESALRIATPDGAPAVINCVLHPGAMTVWNVRGDRVRRWSQAGDRLSVWLQGDGDGDAREPVALEILAWLALDEAGERLAVPSVRVEGAEAVERSVVRLLPEAGLTLIPGALEGLRSVAAAEPELDYVAERPDYSGDFEVRAGAAGTAVRTMTLVEARDGKLLFHSTTEFAVQRGDLRAVAVRLRNWEGEDVKLEVNGAVPLRQRERRRAANDRTWSLEFRPGTTGKLRLVLAGTLSLEEAAAGVPMPKVTIPGATEAENLVAVVGPDLAGESADGLAATEVSSAALNDWPAQAARLRMAGGQAWRVARDDWSLRLRPRGGAEAGPARIVLADHTLVVADGQHWLHEVIYWVRHGANSDLNIVLPKPGTVVAVAVDGVDVAPLQPEQRRLWLPLPGRAGIRAVRVRWSYDPSGEPLAHPLLQTPIVEASIGGPSIWTIFQPPGFEAVSGNLPAPRPGRARAAAAALYRAVAQLRVSAALAEVREGVASSLAAAQQRFYASCRQVEEALSLSDGDGGVSGPNGESLADWRAALLEQDRELAKQHHFEDTRAEAERRADSVTASRTIPDEPEPAGLAGLGQARIRGPLPDYGTPCYLTSNDAMMLPALTLRPIAERRTRESLAASAALLGVLIVAGVIALLPGLRLRLRPFWPELLLLIGFLAWVWSGLTPVAVLFLAWWLACRTLEAAALVSHLFRKRSPAATLAVPPSGT
jgi:hypothetical protein